MFTRAISEAGVVVSENGVKSLTFRKAVAGAPPARDPAETSTADAQKAIAIAKGLARKVRAMLPEGTFNNEMRTNDGVRYITKDSPKFLNNKVDDIFYRLGDLEKEPPDWHKQMAALAWAARFVGGGVCSMLAHVGLGELTLSADDGTEVMLVVDQNFDHSYLVVAWGRSAWFTCDPWVGNVYVTPWSHCYFPQADVSIHYHVTIHKKVTVPYGYEFSATELRMAQNAANATKRPGIKEMDHHYVHEINVLDGRKGQYEPILLPGEWGDGVGREGKKGGAMDIFG